MLTPFLRQAARARVRDRHGALPELRRRAEDHCGDPGAAGHREDPHAPGSAGPGAASGASPWPSPASGLTLPNRDRSGDPAIRAAGVGWVRGFAGPIEAGWRPGIPRGKRPMRTIFGGAIKAQQSCATSRDRLTRIGCRVRGAMGKERRCLKTLSSVRRGTSGEAVRAISHPRQVLHPAPLFINDCPSRRSDVEHPGDRGAQSVSSPRCGRPCSRVRERRVHRSDACSRSSHSELSRY